MQRRGDACCVWVRGLPAAQGVACSGLPATQGGCLGGCLQRRGAQGAGLQRRVRSGTLGPGREQQNIPPGKQDLQSMKISSCQTQIHSQVPMQIPNRPTDGNGSCQHPTQQAMKKLASWTVPGNPGAIDIRRAPGKSTPRVRWTRVLKSQARAPKLVEQAAQAKAQQPAAQEVIAHSDVDHHVVRKVQRRDSNRKRGFRS